MERVTCPIGRHHLPSGQEENDESRPEMNVEERGEVIKGREIGDLSQPSIGRPGSGCLLQSKCNFRRARGGYKKKRGRKLANLESLGIETDLETLD